MPQRRTWVMSDPHFGHGNIIKYCHRPFLCDEDKRELERIGNWHDGLWKGEKSSNHKISQESIRIMDDHLIDQINKYVAPEDTFYILGDFSMFHRKDKGYFERCRVYRERIKCKDVRLCRGNHDEEVIDCLFQDARDLYQVSIEGQFSVLCHYAMAVFNKSHRGAVHLYGHSHACAEPWLDHHMPERRSMDVGVDNAHRLLGEYRPFSFKEIMSMLGNRRGHFMDHHDPGNTLSESELQ